MRTALSLSLVTALSLAGCASHECRHCHHHDGMMMGQPASVVVPQAVQPASDIVKSEPTVQHAVQMTSGPRFGHADDYSWLVGTLQRVNVPDGRWKIRYCPLDVVDRWGGSVILAQDARVDQFKEGDAVFVKGEILVDRPSLYVAGPLYRIHSIENDSVR